MGVVRNLFDGLTNALTGMGGSNDPRSYNQYCFVPLSDQQIATAFRSSWMVRKIIEKPAEEMVREGRDWQTDKANIEKLEAEETRLDLTAKLEQALVLAGLGGGGMVIYIAGDRQDAPLDGTKLRAQSIAKLHVWHKSSFSLGEPIADWLDPWFGHPSYYEVQLQGAVGTRPVKFHPSRVVAFKGHLVPGVVGMSWQDSWWGDSTVQVVKEAVDNAHTAENGFAALIKDARNRRLAVPGLTERLATEKGEAQFRRRAEALAAGENLLGVTFLDAGNAEGKGGETLTDRQMVWSGIPDIKASNLAVVAAAARMPATVLLGKSPDGMNATGKGDLQIWEAEVKSRQDLDLRPCLNQLDVALIPSALGKPDPQVWWKFAPLSTPTEAEEATTFKTTMDAVKVLVDTQMVPDIALSKGIQNLMSERGWLTGLDEALAEVPEDERFPDTSPELDAAGNPIDPSKFQGGGDPNLVPGGGGGSAAARRLAANDARFADATPRSLYVRRDVVNVADLKAWAKKQGLPDLQDGLHVTIAYSREPLDWMKIDGEWNQDAKGEITIQPGGVRIVEPLGDRTAVLLFTSSALTWRHESIVRAGASHDYADYQPHISLTGDPVDLTGVEPYRGKIVLGPEIFEQLREDGGTTDTSLPFDDARSYSRWPPGTRNGGRFAPKGAGSFSVDIPGKSPNNARQIYAATGIATAHLSRSARAQDLNHASRFSKSGRVPPSQKVLRGYADHAATAHTFRVQGSRESGSGLRLRSEITIGKRNYTLIERVGERSKTLSFVTMWENV